MKTLTREESITRITNRLLKTLDNVLKEKALATGIALERLKMHLRTAKIEHLESGDFAITRFHDIARYSKSRADVNIDLWHNIVTTQKQTRAAIHSFVSKHYEGNNE